MPLVYKSVTRYFCIMDLKTVLNENFSKPQCNEVVKWVGNNQKRFDELFGFVYRDQDRIAAKAAWISDYCVEAHPHLIEKHMDSVVVALPNFKQQGVQRSIVRMISRLPLPCSNLGLLLNTCLNWLSDSAITVAVKVHCMEIAANIANQEPAIKPELKAVIEQELPKNTVAFASRAKRILPKLTI